MAMCIMRGLSGLRSKINCSFSSKIQIHYILPQHNNHSKIALWSVVALGLFDLPADGGDDPEETQFRHRMQQKKKQGRRM